MHNRVKGFTHIQVDNDTRLALAYFGSNRVEDTKLETVARVAAEESLLCCMKQHICKYVRVK